MLLVMKLRMKLLFGLCLIVSGTRALNSVNGFFDRAKDGARFIKLFEENLESKDLPTLYYSVNGLKYLDQVITKSTNICKAVQQISKTVRDEESIHFAASIAQVLKCSPDTLPTEFLRSTMQTLDKEDTTLTNLMHAMYTLKALGNKGHDSASAIKSLKEYLKKDNSAANLGLAFHICAEAGCSEWASTHVEDALAQADQVGVDGASTGAMLLHWEGGLPVTSNIITGILKIQGNLPNSLVTQDQSVKLANYLLSRRSVQSVKGAFLLIEAITFMAKEKKVSPICISLWGKGQVWSDSDPIYVSVSDVLGQPHSSVTPDSVIAQSATRLQDDVVVLSKQKLIPHAKEKNLYSLDIMKVKPERGLYKLGVSAGASSAVLPIRVLSAVEIENVEIGVGDVDGSSAPKLNNVQYPKLLTQVLEADSLQRVIMRFTLREKGQNQIAKVHQAFVRLSRKSPDNEVIFVAEQETNKAYRMDLDVGSVAENFQHESGLYNMELIIGDSCITNPFRWNIGEVNLKFSTKKADSTIVTRETKPEIVHMFREPEVRPPRLVSDVFTGLCIMPILLLFVLWGKIGINVRNFPFSLSALGFHLGLGGILGLFVVFWLRLTMFETIRYLLAVGLITFICGHRLLTDVAAKRKNPK